MGGDGRDQLGPGEQGGAGGPAPRLHLRLARPGEGSVQVDVDAGQDPGLQAGPPLPGGGSAPGGLRHLTSQPSGGTPHSRCPRATQDGGRMSGAGATMSQSMVKGMKGMVKGLEVE